MEQVDCSICVSADAGTKTNAFNLNMVLLSYFSKNMRSRQKNSLMLKTPCVLQVYATSKIQSNVEKMQKSVDKKRSPNYFIILLCGALIHS